MRCRVFPSPCAAIATLEEVIANRMNLFVIWLVSGPWQFELYAMGRPCDGESSSTSRTDRVRATSRMASVIDGEFGFSCSALHRDEQSTS